MTKPDMAGLPEMPSARLTHASVYFAGCPLICPEWLGLRIEPQGCIDIDISDHCLVLLSETVSLACWRPLTDSYYQKVIAF
jgi:hypothetical protein